MNSLQILIPVFLYLFPAQDNAELTLIIEDVKDFEGEFMIAVYDKAENFTDKPLSNMKKAVKSEESQKIGLKIPYGTYSVAIFQDMNDNGELDKNFFGVPKEAFGFTNKSISGMGKPSFEETKFEFSKKQAEVKITLKHF